LYARTMPDELRHITMYVVREPAAGTPDVSTPTMGVALTRRSNQPAVAYDCGECGQTVFIDELNGPGHDRYIYHCANCGKYNQVLAPGFLDHTPIAQG
jgi:DNA-directed RNA polymerase subunit RPC12/RpoP